MHPSQPCGPHYFHNFKLWVNKHITMTILSALIARCRLKKTTFSHQVKTPYHPEILQELLKNISLFLPKSKLQSQSLAGIF